VEARRLNRKELDVKCKSGLVLLCNVFIARNANAASAIYVTLGSIQTLPDLAMIAPGLWVVDPLCFKNGRLRQ